MVNITFKEAAKKVVAIDPESVFQTGEAALYIEGIEAMILIAMPQQTELVMAGEQEGFASLFDDDQLTQLRHIVYSCSIEKACDHVIAFSIGQLKAIEDILPPFGAVDENSYSPLRIKISNAILRDEALLSEESDADQESD